MIRPEYRLSVCEGSNVVLDLHVNKRDIPETARFHLAENAVTAVEVWRIRGDKRELVRTYSKNGKVKMRNSWTVYYRVGGTEKFEWRKCLPVLSLKDAIVQRQELEQAGYRAHYAPTNHLDAIGLPETYE